MLNQKQNNDMEQITEDYVSFETAKLLKQKRFDIITEKCYILDKSGLCAVTVGQLFNGKPQGKYEIAAPTLQMAMKWLRQVHNLHIRTAIFTYYADDADGNTVDEWCFWDYMIFPTSGGKAIYEHQEEVTGYGVEPDTCEGAQEAAIKYCLTNLID